MYERMLEKQKKPEPEEFTAYCGTAKQLFLALDEYMTVELGLSKEMRFPYGNSYGWSYKYTAKSKLICDVFAERDAFTVMIRMTNQQCDKLYDSMSDYTKGLMNQKYPCGEGGWIHDRILNDTALEDVKKMIQMKAGKKE